MKTLVFWRRGSAARARDLQARGVRVFAWEGADLGPLRGAGVDFTRLADLSVEEQDAVDEAAMAWTKAWGQRPIDTGRSFRELLSWSGVSLWWFAELYLHHSTEAPGRVRLIETLHRVFEKEAPVEVEAVGLGREEAVLLGRTCMARGILFDGPRRPTRLRSVTRVALCSARSRLNSAKMLATVVKNLLAPAPEGPGQQEGGGENRRVVLFLSHAAFWKERAAAGGEEGPSEYEHYFDRLIPGVAGDPGLRPFVLAVGPRAAFRRRRLLDRLGDWFRVSRENGPYVHVNRFMRLAVFRRVLAATREIRRAWRRLRRSPGVREAFAHRGVNFADMSAADLAGTMLLQLPWAVRSREEMAAALETVSPAVLCLYAETSGWGRAALAAARAAGVPSVALQHGILYPKYFSYRRAAGEEESPRPDRTAVFGEEARRLLVSLGGYRDDEIVITGSPKFDDLLSAARLQDRAVVRAGLGLAPGETLVVVASRYRAISDTHSSIGSAFPAFVAAVSAIPGLVCLVKPHPAEPADAYVECIREAGATRVRLVPPESELVDLLNAADALVTVESLSAAEALVLGRPVLLLNMPNNLRGLVDQGVALGVETGADPGLALHAVLFDEATRTALADARQRYLSDVAHGVDGGATDRILGLIRETARSRRGRV